MQSRKPKGRPIAKGLLRQGKSSLSERINRINFLQPRGMEDAEKMVSTLSQRVISYENALMPWKLGSYSWEDTLMDLTHEMAEMDLRTEESGILQGKIEIAEKAKPGVADMAMKNFYLEFAMDGSDTSLLAESRARKLAENFAGTFINDVHFYLAFEAAKGRYTKFETLQNPFEYVLQIYELGLSPVCHVKIPSIKNGRENFIVYVPLDIDGMKELGAYVHEDKKIIRAGTMVKRPVS
jgi:hypothetical protein